VRRNESGGLAGAHASSQLDDGDLGAQNATTNTPYELRTTNYALAMKIATWNINSVRLRIDSVRRFLKEAAPDVLCLQEIKCRDDQFPAFDFAATGYKHQAISGQKGYHGVAIVSRLPLADVEKRNFAGREDSRHIAATIAGIRLHNFYVPAGGDEPNPDLNAKFAHKLDFMRDLGRWSAGGAAEKQKVALVGDLNIAPREHDVWSHKQLLDVVSHTPVETGLMNEAIAAGSWTDVARALIPEPEKVYTWWSYRAHDWRVSNRGRRLDHVWVSRALKRAALGKGREAFAVHDRCRGWEKPSDHVPVTLALAL